MATRDIVRAVSLLGSGCKSTSKVDIEDQVGAFDEVLGHIDSALLMAAAKEWLRSETWMPSPAELLKVTQRIKAESAKATAEPEHWRHHTVRCKECHDTGFISVWMPQAMRSALSHARGEIDDQRLMQSAVGGCVRCECERGQRLAERWPTYREGTHVRCGDPWSALDGLKAWAKDYKPSNYVAEFDSF